MQTQRAFRTSGIDYPVTRLHIQEEGNPKPTSAKTSKLASSICISMANRFRNFGVMSFHRWKTAGQL